MLESTQATVEWSFPANCSDLSQFRVIIRKEDSGEVVDEVVVAAEKRLAQIDGLKPSTKYSVTVAAVYNDGGLKQSRKEHVTCGMLTCKYIALRIPVSHMILCITCFRLLKRGCVSFRSRFLASL